MDRPEPDLHPSSALSMAADRYRCYSGETIKLYLRIVVPKTSGALLQVSLPHVMHIEAFKMPDGIPASLVSLSEQDQEILLSIPLIEPFMQEIPYEIRIDTRVVTYEIDQYLLSEARLIDSGSNQTAYASVQTAVSGKAAYQRYLPEIYESDGLMNRMLMLFESFWRPVSSQIDQMDCYFDPLLTPIAFVPWLASWIGMPFDSSISDVRKRDLLRFAMMFYQQRGTFKGLKKYLEIYTGGEVSVIERRATNFVLGERCKLGVEVALGKGNQPNSIQIGIRVPEEEISGINYSREMYQRKLNEIVRTIVPAHTVYDIQCDFYQTSNAGMMKGN